MTDAELIDYCEAHAETPRCGFAPITLSRLYTLAGMPDDAKAWGAIHSSVINCDRHQIRRAVEKARARLCAPSNVTTIPSLGFARGAVVRRHGGGPNMLVVRGLGDRTAVIAIEGDEGGNLRLRDVATADLVQVLDPGPTSPAPAAE